jgi:ribosomal protein L11 methyltransferase
MDYIELSCKITPFSEEMADFLTAQLGELEFESFTTTETGVDAYIQEPLFDMDQVMELWINQMPDAPFKIEYSHKKIEGQDWNALWESNFQPVIIADKVVIRASFHTDLPKVPYDIVIDPKMSFGTGHHSTTSLMVETILENEMENKRVLDMGCGTSILGIMASKRGAAHVTGIDIDEWAYNNSVENIKNNGANVEVHQGDASMLAGKNFDVILANINRNILLNDMKHYVACLEKQGILVMSGFYTEDLDSIRTEAESNGLEYHSHKVDKNWVAVKFIKK